MSEHLHRKKNTNSGIKSVSQCIIMLINNCPGSGSGGLNNLEFTLYQDSSIVISTISTV